jgi:sugar lactone lactonase YvrE
LWVTDAAGNWVAHITPDGQVLTVVPFPAVNGEQAVPTGVAVGPDGNAYVALFRCQQPTQGKGGVARVKPDGTYDIAVSGLSNPIDVAFDSHGNLYVLEFAVDCAPETGALLRVGPDGSSTVVIDGLTYPTSVAFDTAGDAYISEIAAVSGGSAGTGTLLRFDGVGS